MCLPACSQVISCSTQSSQLLRKHVPDAMLLFNSCFRLGRLQGLFYHIVLYVHVIPESATPSKHFHIHLCVTTPSIAATLNCCMHSIPFPLDLIAEANLVVYGGVSHLSAIHCSVTRKALQCTESTHVGHI
jgi:hypothetical protein